MEFLEGCRNDLANFVGDVRNCFQTDKKNLLTLEELECIQRFSLNCRQHLAGGFSLLSTVPPRGNSTKKGLVLEIYSISGQITHELKSIDGVITFMSKSLQSDKKIGCNIVGGAAATTTTAVIATGAAKAGLLVGAPYLGVMTGIGAIIGSLGSLAVLHNAGGDEKINESPEVRILLPNLMNLLEDVKTFDELMRAYFGQERLKVEKKVI